MTESKQVSCYPANGSYGRKPLRDGWLVTFAGDENVTPSVAVSAEACLNRADSATPQTQFLAGRPQTGILNRYPRRICYGSPLPILETGWEHIEKC